MKPKIILIALLLGTGLVAFAQKQKTKPLATALQFPDVFTSLVVEDNLTVVLTEGTSAEILVEGNEKDLDAREVDGTLIIQAAIGSSLNETKIYVPATLLSKVYLNGTGTLRSATTLQNRRLKIILTGEAKVDVRSVGNLTVETWDGIEFIKGQ